MEVKLDKRYPVAASLEQAWAVLSDIHATASCMPGAQITEQVGPTHYKGTVKTKVGPATMLFNGDIEVQGLDAALRQLQMLGKGADKSGSSASMQLKAHLEPADDGCVLVGSATVTVSGKLAQFGSRLLVPVSDAMLAQFADNFRATAAAVPAALPDVSETTVMRMVQGSQAPGDPGAVDLLLPAAETAPAPATPAAPAAPAATAAAAASTPAAASTTAVAPGAVSVPTAPGAPTVPARVPVAPRPVKELNALALLWTVIKGWFAGLFGRKGA